MDISTRQRAQQMSASLSPASPHFVKELRRSHVSRRFRFSIPKGFSHSYLPDHNSQVVLVDDNDDQYETSYTFDTSSLSGPGWRDFSTSHALMEQDYLVFELVDDCKFKMYIVKHNPVEEDYSIFVAGESINEEVNLNCRVKYYELCSSQDTILHSTVLEFVHIKVVAGMIIETTRIADCVREITGTSDAVEKLEARDDVLENFERIGMKVRFVRARIAQLLVALQQVENMRRAGIIREVASAPW
ncbi:B3 domain-containing protein At3g19184-like [Salvia hispanica]|uniref:B3 domain-containing protein At3g19184-like n=1 Tax=Salvia hispanica TaxID=49212 RepID=UPI002009C4C5|nr:B3 domain-containing protein At3g19184-like [Salvia hispanica]